MTIISKIFRKTKNVIRIHEDIRIYLDLINNIGSKDIHYGYWKNKNEDFNKAQINLSEFVISKIPPNSDKILDVGGGIGGFSEVLRKKGHKAVCIVPDKKLIDYGKKIFSQVNFIHETAEYFRVNALFDGAILIESFQYFSDKGKAIKNIIDNLKKNSFMMIIDEFDYSPNKSNLPKEKRLINSLKRYNYNLIHDLDLTNNVLPTCDFVSKYFEDKNQSVVINWKYKKNLYLSKKLKYKLLIFERT